VGGHEGPDRPLMLRCKSPQVAQTASSRQCSATPTMEAKRTVGGRGSAAAPDAKESLLDKALIENPVILPV